MDLILKIIIVVLVVFIIGFIKYTVWFNRMKENSLYMTEKQFRSAYPNVYRILRKKYFRENEKSNLKKEDLDILDQIKNGRG